MVRLTIDVIAIYWLINSLGTRFSKSAVTKSFKLEDKNVNSGNEWLFIIS